MVRALAMICVAVLLATPGLAHAREPARNADASETQQNTSSGACVSPTPLSCRRSAQVDAAGLVEIANRHGYIAQLESKVDGLKKKLGIEHEIVAVAFEGDRFQHLTRIGPKAAVPLAEVLPGENVFDNGQAAVHEILDGRHVPA